MINRTVSGCLLSGFSLALRVLSEKASQSQINLREPGVR